MIWHQGERCLMASIDPYEKSNIVTVKTVYVVVVGETYIGVSEKAEEQDDYEIVKFKKAEEQSLTETEERRYGNLRMLFHSQNDLDEYKEAEDLKKYFRKAVIRAKLSLNQLRRIKAIFEEERE